jgi:hypothetical protein
LYAILLAIAPLYERDIRKKRKGRGQVTGNLATSSQRADLLLTKDEARRIIVNAAVTGVIAQR